MKLSDLRIGNLIAKVPIVQGGMAVRVSTAPLAAAVANEGGIGLIAGSGLKVEELKEEIRKARELSQGIIGVNIMVAVREFKELVDAAVSEGIDLIVAGAGFSRDLFTVGKETGVEIVPIVSSVKLAKISEKLGASAIVVEGKEAGGHLGTDQPMKTLVEKIVKAVKIPVIAAGGIIDGKDIAEVLKLGASGVQMGSRFVASTECEVDDSFKQTYINASKEDSVLINSPVGLPGRALKNEFFDRLSSNEVDTGKSCDYICLKKCSHSFCIMDSLIKAQEGNMTHGLVFAGERAHLIDKVLPVKEIINNLVSEARKYLGGEEEDE
ncbi:NAD(P)H-dependent flavin oxidoreductase YrpB (nitropropane dioxygenase family) [Orenia metallireducens]|uniref:Probable nitronate monooxygenase n=1 Tax=Orenia metallireducens TaxID=1413210 RepID=A0A285HIF5_9FIRM|nr:nitronate monooxygenase [Orenia metallireducens]PRX27458.1 NAD(P)H-dependent flavin oxidoreductase YrpB (nitropropane dioxygenase family) [Orenia metallireducens]SNY34566.1 NAD(P)H-dependent flavin oxidoreductase YrpB, nitropropane dioxygenase family [Orenia metallireducens]